MRWGYAPRQIEMTRDEAAREAKDGESESARSAAPPFLVAGLGASAGGLEAVSRLLQAIPQDAALALVLVQHRGRDHQSLLPELLSKQTWMNVQDARDGTAIERGHLYIIPPEARMTVVDSCLRVTPMPGESRDAPVNHLFESLADHYGERAIGIVLSGAGRDGAIGIAKIKAGGGVTMAQDPAEAKVDGMPRAAVGGGTDLVLPVADIAAELTRLSHHPFFRQPAPAPGQPSADADDSDGDRDLRVLFQLLRRSTGVDFGLYKTPTVRRRIEPAWCCIG